MFYKLAAITVNVIAMVLVQKRCNMSMKTWLLIIAGAFGAFLYAIISGSIYFQFINKEQFGTMLLGTTIAELVKIAFLVAVCQKNITVEKAIQFGMVFAILENLNINYQNFAAVTMRNLMALSHSVMLLAFQQLVQKYGTNRKGYMLGILAGVSIHLLHNIQGIFFNAIVFSGYLVLGLEFFRYCYRQIKIPTKNADLVT